MAARGTESKETIKNKILSQFEGAFIASDGKTIRIPMMEDGDTVEIKVALTAAKDIEGNFVGATDSETPQVIAEPVVTEPTEEEKARVSSLLNTLGF